MPILLASALPFALWSVDPAPGLFRSKARSRRLDCTWVSPAEAHRQAPGQVAAPRPRGDFAERQVYICRERLLRPGLRAPQDEAVLSSLREQSTGLAALAASLHPAAAARTWLVDTHYAHPEVAAKVTFATRNALAEQGLSVSDRVPRLAVGDLEVITRMPPSRAFPAACRRYAANGTLAPGDALLLVASRDPRETVLHAGVCAEGHWTWLR